MKSGDEIERNIIKLVIGNGETPLTLKQLSEFFYDEPFGFVIANLNVLKQKGLVTVNHNLRDEMLSEIVRGPKW